MSVTYTILTEPTDSQLRAIVDLYRQAGWWWTTGLHLDTARRIVAGSHVFCIAEIDGVVVGMGRAISDQASDAYIQDLTVSERFRHQGIASGLVQTLVGRLRQDGIGWIGVVAADNTAPFYRRLGFAPMADAQPMLLEC